MKSFCATIWRLTAPNLANERTFLAYTRTALTCLLGGVTLHKLFPADGGLQGLAWFLLAISGLTALFGIWRSLQTHRRIKAHYTAERRDELTSVITLSPKADNEDSPRPHAKAP